MNTIQIRRNLAWLAAGIFALFAFILASPASAATATYYVDASNGTDNPANGGSSGAGAWATIEYAIGQVANPTVDDITINIADDTYTTSNDEIDIDRNFTNLILQGEYADTTIVQSHADPDSSTARVFDIGSTENVTIKDLQIRYGRTTSTGAAIEQSSGGSLTLEDVYIYDNDGTTSSDYGGVYSTSDTTITNSTFEDNDGLSGGALYVNGSSVAVEITNSTFFNNGSNSSNGAVYFNGPEVTITNSLFAQNREVLFQGSNDIYVKNSIFVDGTTTYDIEYYNFFGTVYAENTIAGNEEDDGSSPYVVDGTDGNIVVDDLTLEDLGFSAYPGTNDNTSTYTRTVGIVSSGNPAIDAGDNTAHNSVSIPSTDQRGKARSGSTDIGPFEYQGSDEVSPYFVSAALADDNTYVDITFNEGIYGPETGALSSVDLEVNFSANGGNATDVTIDDLVRLDGQSTAGGETTVRAEISITGTASGVETFTISPVEFSVMDVELNEMSTVDETDTLTLNGAEEYYVRADGNDSNDGSADNSGNAWLTLQHAVDTVSNPTTTPIIINVSGDTYDLNNDDVSIDRGFTNLTIRGTGADSTVFQAHNTPGSATNRVFSVGSSEIVAFEDLTIEHGRTSGSFDGAGIDVSSGGVLTLTRVTIDDNDASGSVSAAVVTQGDVHVTDSTFNGNHGNYVGALFASASNQTGSISNSTFFDNTGSSGAVYFNSYNMTVTNSIFTQGDEFLLQGSYDAYIKNSAFFDNTAFDDIDYYNFFGDVYAENTIVGSEEVSGSSPFITDGVDGNSVVGEDSLTDLNVATSLADNSTVNGTQTLALSAGSSLINAGDSDSHNDTVIPALDQRGATRVGAVDIGPYEYNGVVDGPYVTELYPADDATGIAIDDNLLITFSEAITVGTGDIDLYEADDTLVESFDVTTDISGGGTTQISINPTSDLTAGESYYVQIDATAFDDGSANSYEGISDETTWTFTAAESTAPTVTTLTPLDNATGVAVDANLVIEFDEAVNPGVGSVDIYNDITDTIEESINVNSDQVTGEGTTTITIDPSSDLGALVGYYVQIDATAFEDLLGNAYAGINDATTWNFETDGTAGVTTGVVSGDAAEDGSTATFTVELDTQPTDDVVIGVSSADTGEGTVSPSSLTFTSGNWDTPQTVTVTGIDDDLDDGDIDYDIVLGAATSTDGNYSGLDAADVSVTTTDDDTAAVTVSAIPVLVTEGGSVDDIRIVLESEPTADVVVAMSDSNGEVTMAASITFTSENWDEQQNVQVTAIDDDVDEDSEDGSVAFTVTSADGNYNGYSVANKAVDVTDNDTAGVTASAISGATQEDGTTATFTVELDTEPLNNVVIGVSSSDTGEGTVSPSSLTFTSGNWDTPQTVTVTGVDDEDDDGNIVYSAVLGAATSADGNYSGLNPSDVTVTNVDDDQGSITVSGVTGTLSEETEGDATFTVVLDAEPTDDVVIGVSSSDTGEGTVSPSSLTFTDGNWNTPQTVTVTAVDDDIDDGNIGFTIVLGAATSTDANYNGVDPNDVAVTNVDDDTALATVNPGTINVTEDGLIDGLYIVLGTEPTEDVVFNFTLDEDQVTLEADSMTFTSENWDEQQSIQVTAIDDDVAEGEHSDIINFSVTSDDPVYGAFDPYYRGVVITDNDTAGVTASSISDDTSEDGDSATFTVELDSEPTADVTVPVSSSDTGEGTVSPSSLTFTSGNWDTPQTVTVTGVNDDAADGDQDFSAVIGEATSADDNYDELDGDDVSVTNLDNDTGTVVVSDVSGTLSEAGDTATFTIWPQEMPDSFIFVEVELPLSVSDPTQATVSPSEIVWTSTSWNGPQTVTVTALDDDIDEGAHATTVVLGEITDSGADNYDGYDADDVLVTIVDNDTAGITVSEETLAVTEGGATDSFTVVLDTEPTDDVVVGFTASSSDVSFSADTLTFTNENWDTAQTLTVTATDDSTAEESENVTIGLTVTSEDANYDEFELDLITATVTDNDEADSGDDTDGDDDSGNDDSELPDPVNNVETGEGDGSGDSESTLGNATSRTRMEDGLIEIFYEGGDSKVFKMFNINTKPKAVLHTNKDVVIAITKKYMRTYDAYTGERLDQVKLFKKKQAHTRMKRFNIYKNKPGQNNVIVLGRYKKTQKKKVNMRSFVVKNNGNIVRRNIQRIELQRNTKFSKLKVTKNKKNGKQALIRLIRKRNIVHAHKYRVTKKKGRILPPQ